MFGAVYCYLEVDYGWSWVLRGAKFFRPAILASLAVACGEVAHRR